MYNKFIITQDGTMLLGNVYLHRDLLPPGHDTCHGGGLWQIDNQNCRLMLFGKSFDFGYPDFSKLRRVDRADFPGNMRLPMFYVRMWPSDDFPDEVLAPEESCIS